MIGRDLIKIFEQIIKDTKKTLRQYVDLKDLTGKLDFVSIYAVSKVEFERISNELKKNGIVVDHQKSGDYYSPIEDLTIDFEKIKRLRVRRFDEKHKERGYCDFEVTDFINFKNKYLAKPFFTLVTNEHGVEMLELQVPKSNIRIFFPNVKF